MKCLGYIDTHLLVDACIAWIDYINYIIPIQSSFVQTIFSKLRTYPKETTVR